MRRMLSEKDANKVRLLDNVERNIEGEIVVSDDILFDGDVKIDTDFFLYGIKIGVDEDGRIGQYVKETQQVALTSYSEIELGKTYHVIIPAGVSFTDISAEYVAGTVSNFTPSSELGTRNAGDTRTGFGTSAGPTYGNGLESISAGTQNIIVRPTTEQCEFDITIIYVYHTENDIDNLYQYMYKNVEVEVFKKFLIEDDIE